MSERFVQQHALFDSLFMGERQPAAVAVLTEYYREPLSGKLEHGYSGRFFERYASHQHPNYISPADVVALHFLSMDRLGAVAMALEVEENKIAIGGLLARMPAPQVPLHEVGHEVIARGSAAWQLHDFLKTMGGRNRRVTADKLLARKRPHLLPPIDNDVRRLLGGNIVNIWDCYWSWFHPESEVQRDQRIAAVKQLGLLANLPPEVSLVRRMDVVLWMQATGRVR